MRYSSRREAIREAVQSTRSHPSAEWVYEKVRQSIPSISLGTVYRNLKELSASGEIDTLETESGSVHFDAYTEPHAHFVCRKCGKIYDLSAGGAYANTCKEAGHSVDAEKTVLYGICRECVN